ncbi:hypothetical protein BSY239_3124 [Hydrogenophaga sp. RAC07]|uniref:DUF2254 domain-containing protein n=1 Tax=Hydrogenophaga sp. RAC07 TaxID=1842537 RepID=UPI00085548D2|nr:DUF2254 family protein [Hydrogenophaga sp. RAC07]AOF85606.1 hypothetical protein BSY239_3124 [Hydrogenophaga sp. RAC07]
MSLYRALIWLKAAENRLWVKPAVGSVVAVLIALVAAVGNRLIPAGLLPDIERSTLDNLLGVIASSMLGVATFSLSIMVAAFSSAAVGASPRAIQLVAGDSDTQNAITTFISAFIYAIIANTALGLGLYGGTGRFILFVCTMGVLLYLIVTLVRWVKTLSVLGRMENTLAKLETAAVGAMDAYRRSPGMGARTAHGPMPTGAPVRANKVGYLRHIDMQTLQEQAVAASARLHVRVRPGQLVHPGTVLVIVEAGADNDKPDPDPDALRQTFVLGDGRSFDQDPRFGLIVLCEVAQRALSPAVNDPGTAIAAMNTITRVLVDTPTDPVARETPLDRLTLVPLDPADFIHQAFDPIARDGAAVPEVQLRMQKLLSIVAEGCDEEVGNAARRQAATSLQRAMLALVLEEDKTRLCELHTTLFSGSPVAA